MSWFNRLSLLLLTLNGLPIWADVESHFADLQTDPKALYAFFKDMPKGGELHYHLAGGAYPETMLALAASHQGCLNPTTWAVTVNAKNCGGIWAKDALTQPAIYNQVIRAWSMKDFNPQQESGHDHFFATFEKFMPIVDHYSPELLADILERAASQKLSYMELMILPDKAQSIAFAPKQLKLDDLDAPTKQLLANPSFEQTIQYTRSETARLLPEARALLGCSRNPKLPVCQIQVKFQYYILRELPLNQLFAQALNGFAAASQSPDLVAVNIVQAEDSPITIANYKAQMRIIDFLHQRYPTVQLALHAGELAKDAVTPEHLRFHIQEAVVKGHAKRIGHGVSIAKEDNALALLKMMREKDIAVEINLSSNDRILGVTKKQHPLRFYLKHAIPVVLSTDDEGVLRTDLTSQYVRAAFEHGLSYSQLKQINRNGLSYAFLPGLSLWEDNSQAKPVAHCVDLNSKSCLAWVKHHHKARLQRQLELDLLQFEKAWQTST